jgi:hypothetical protein
VAQTSLQRKFCAFIDLLVKNCAKRILFEESFVPVVFLYLKELSQSVIRSFRHTATLTGS